ncbi:MAG: methyltransferase domain-containing protein [Alphaproteobacteria bacterium]|nr:methyltransferase domain-containing protein [Alphaproteobacteria bacterium]
MAAAPTSAQSPARSPARSTGALQIKQLIRRRYARLAGADAFQPDPRATALAAGCPTAWYDALPARAAQAFSGCGWPAGDLDPTGIETIIDLGCGGGLDSRFLAERLNKNAQVVALDLTPEVLDRARETLTGVAGATVRLLAADLEQLPLADACADAVIANAALNLATEAQAAFAEIARVLRPGGRLVAADLVRVGALPAEILADPMAMAASLGGVMEEADLLAVIEGAGLNNVAITGHRPFGPVIAVNISATR